MRILHLADLHIGKKINNLSLLEDEDYILKSILKIIDEKKIETVLIAGDIYDKSIPSEEAVNMLDDFLYSLANRKLNVLIISGNHDSVERLSFGDRLIEKAGIYISPEYDGKVKVVKLNDDYGSINFYLLPFVKPVNVKRFFPTEEINDYSSALKVAINNMNVDYSERNIILSHQFVTGAKVDGSEDLLSLGGLTNVDASVYEKFDYTALGHIHRPQNVKGETIRYAGSPIKFSFDEEKQHKGVTIVEIKEKGNITVENIPLKAKRDFITLKGKYEELIKGNSEVNKDDFVSIVLTDELDVTNAFSNLSVIYPNLMTISYDNKSTNNRNIIDGSNIDDSLSPQELFAQFYLLRNDKELDDQQKKFVEELIEEIWR